MARGKLRLIGALVVSTMASALLFGSVGSSSAATLPATHQPAAASSIGSFTNIPVTGTTADGGTFTGVLTVTRFVATSTGIKAIGTLSGTITDASNNVVGSVVDQAVRIPLTASSGTCQILHLELGPLDLNLLGLKVHLDKVVLDITAQRGPGNLLGNLLCAIAHLLDGTLTGSTLNDTLANLLTAVVKLVGALNLIG